MAFRIARHLALTSRARRFSASSVLSGVKLRQSARMPPDVGVTAVRPGAAGQQKYRNGFEIDDHLSVRSPPLLDDRTSEACCSFAS